MISHHQQVKISPLYFMDVPFGDRLKNVNKTLDALAWNASEVHGPQRMNPEDFTIPWHDPAQPTSPSFTLNMSTSTSCIDKKTLQTFRVPRWWNLMTNFSSAVTSRLNFLIHNDGLIDGLSWKGSDIRGPHRMDRDKFADPVTFHFAPSNSDVIINFSMQSFYHCEHVSMLTSAFRLF